MDDPADLISVYRAANVTEAHLVKNLLLDEGMDAVVAEESEPLIVQSIASPEVLVRRADEGRARVLIERYDAEQEQRADRPDWICTKCGASVVGAFDECDVCGTNRPGSELADEA